VQGERAKEVSIVVGSRRFRSPGDLAQEFSHLVGTPVFGGKHESFAMIDGYFPDLAGWGNMPTAEVDFPARTQATRGSFEVTAQALRSAAGGYGSRCASRPTPARARPRSRLPSRTGRKRAIAPATFEVRSWITNRCRKKVNRLTRAAQQLCEEQSRQVWFLSQSTDRQVEFQVQLVQVQARDVRNSTCLRWSHPPVSHGFEVRGVTGQFSTAIPRPVLLCKKSVTPARR